MFFFNSSTINIFRLGSTAASFCFITYHNMTSCMATSMNRHTHSFSSSIVKSFQIRYKPTVQLFHGILMLENTTHVPRFTPPILLHEYDVHLILKD